MTLNISTPWRLLITVACTNAMFFMPVVIAYYYIKGADLADFLLIQGLFRIAVMVLEVPTGYLADRWSRPLQLKAAAFIWLISMVMLFQADSFNGLLWSEMLAALSVSLSSGTVQAYMHEALRAEGKSHQQAKW
jgi:MFS family permease